MCRQNNTKCRSPFSASQTGFMGFRPSSGLTGECTFMFNHGNILLDEIEVGVKE